MNGTQFIEQRLNLLADSINCCLLAKISSFNKTNSKVSVEPLYRVHNANGTVEKLPQLIEVPLLQFASNNYIIKAPLAVGDTVLLMFSDYDIQNIVLTGDVATANSNDFHALNDAIAIPFNLIPFTADLSVLDNDDLIIGAKDETSTIVINDDKVEIKKDNMTITFSENNLTINSNSNDININTTGDADVNIDCNLFNVTQRGL